MGDLHLLETRLHGIDTGYTTQHHSSWRRDGNFARTNLRLNICNFIMFQTAAEGKPHNRNRILRFPFPFFGASSAVWGARFRAKPMRTILPSLLSSLTLAQSAKRLHALRHAVCQLKSTRRKRENLKINKFFIKMTTYAGAE